MCYNRNMFKKASLPVRFFLSYLIVIVLVLAIVSLTIFVLQMRTTTILVDDSLKNMMSVVKSEPGVQQAFTDDADRPVDDIRILRARRVSR